MIMELTKSAPVLLEGPDVHIACGFVLQKTGALGLLDWRKRYNARHDAALTIALMQDGDRSDYARMLSLVDGD